MSPVRVGRKFASFTDAEIDALPEGTEFFADGESAAVVETTGRGLRWCGPRDGRGSEAVVTDKQAAHHAVAAAVSRGVLMVPPTCEACGGVTFSPGAKRAGSFGRTILFHHWSYLPEHHLDVIPLCFSCHAKVHGGRLPEPRTCRMYPIRLPGRRAALAAPPSPLPSPPEHEMSKSSTGRRSTRDAARTRAAMLTAAAQEA